MSSLSVASTFAHRSLACVILSGVFALCLPADAASTGPASLSQLSKFVWSEEDGAITFGMELSSPSRAPRLTDQIGEKRYFYLDFFHSSGPTDARQWNLDNPLVTTVKRAYYPEVKVLRLIFYTATNKPLELKTEGFGSSFTLKAAGITLSPVGGGVPGKPGTRKIIVIDPGHGGISTGARTTRPVNGRHYHEKEVTLQIAQRLAAIIRQSPNMDCVLTRTADVDVGLEERVRIAEAAKGDLFVSLHLNASGSRSNTARGLEVYYLSDGGKATNKQLEELENEGEMQSTAALAGHESLKSILGSLASDMVQKRRQESLRLSSLIDDNFRRQGPFTEHPRGVKSAAFRVLMNFAMPSVLVETGFIDNPQDAALVTDPVMQQQTAAILFNAINKYFAQIDPRFQPQQIALQTPPPRPEPPVERRASPAATPARAQSTQAKKVGKPATSGKNSRTK